MKTVIAIPQMGSGLFRKYMKSKYVERLRRAGAEVRWIELHDEDEMIRQLLECDGLLLPGGADIDPKLYGQAASDRCGKPNALRDAGEMKMLEAFMPTKKPILCICRGVQLLNVFFGGTLYQDIKKLQLRKHSDFRTRKTGTHKVKLLPRTKLSKIFNEELLCVNSLHHQTADQVGPGLTVSAVSEDGFIEGLEVFLHPFCVGVQWHPEHMSKENPRQQKLFDVFVSACKGGDSRD